MYDLLSGLRSLMTETGAIMAAPSSEYRAWWLRDQLYCVLALREAGETQEAERCFRVVLQTLQRHRDKIQYGPWDSEPHHFNGFLHAKYTPTLDEVTPQWGHHQLDALGLLLFTAAEMRDVLTEDDLSSLRYLVRYVDAAQYWRKPDFGMWEEFLDPHASSIGAVVSGLRKVREFIEVREGLIEEGERALAQQLPSESPYHGTDLALLSLVWPYRILTSGTAVEIIERVESQLVRPHGTIRYSGDRYAGPGKWTAEDEEPEWPLGLFWLSICRSVTGDSVRAKKWFECGVREATEHSYLPEIYVGGTPNDNTPLAWAHAKGIIAQAHL